MSLIYPTVLCFREAPLGAAGFHVAGDDLNREAPDVLCPLKLVLCAPGIFKSSAAIDRHCIHALSPMAFNVTAHLLPKV